MIFSFKDIFFKIGFKKVEYISTLNKAERAENKKVSSHINQKGGRTNN